MSQDITAAMRKDIREAAARLAEFPGNKGVACTNPECYLGRYAIPLLDALEETEKRLFAWYG